MKSKWDWHRVTLEAIRSVCGFGYKYQPQMISHRIFVISVQLGNLIFIVSVLAIFMKTVTTQMFAHRIETIREIVQNSYKLIGDEFALQHLMRQNEVSTNVQITVNSMFKLISTCRMSYMNINFVCYLSFQ